MILNERSFSKVLGVSEALPLTIVIDRDGSIREII